VSRGKRSGMRRNGGERARRVRREREGHSSFSKKRQKRYGSQIIQSRSNGDGVPAIDSEKSSRRARGSRDFISVKTVSCQEGELSHEA